MSKVVILDGVGINMKTTLMNRLKDQGYQVLPSDSEFYIENKRDLFPNMNDCINKIQSRYLEIRTAMQYSDRFRDGILFVDRGIVNQIIWAKILYNDLVDDYLNKKDDYKKLMDTAEGYVKLEDSLHPIRFLIRTRNKQIISESLSDDRYYNGTEHDVFRIDTFDNPEKYNNIQKYYYRYHKELVKSIRYDLTDSNPTLELMKYEYFILENVYHYDHNNCMQ